MEKEAEQERVILGQVLGMIRMKCPECKGTRLIEEHTRKGKVEFYCIDCGCAFNTKGKVFKVKHT